MSKRRVERDIEQLEENVLGELETDERVRLAVLATIHGRDSHLDTLLETCPKYTYYGADIDYTDGYRLASFLAHDTVSVLHTALLYYEMAILENENALFREMVENGSLPKSLPRRPIVPLAQLYISYHVRKRYAEEELGLQLTEWLGIVQNGRAIVSLVQELIGEESIQYESIRTFVDSMVEATGEAPDVPTVDSEEALIDHLFEELTRAYERKDSEDEESASGSSMAF